MTSLIRLINEVKGIWNKSAFIRTFLILGAVALLFVLLYNIDGDIRKLALFS